MVLRPDADFRGFAGRVAAGVVRPGDAIRVMPSGVEATVRALPAFGGDRAEAQTGESVLVQLDREVDVSRGDVLAAAPAPTGVADQFEARVLWMGHADLVAGRSYLFKLHTREARATVTAIRHRVDLNTGAALSAQHLSLNDIGVVTLAVSQPVPYEPYSTNRTMGGGVLIDPVTFDTVGAVLIDFALRRSGNLHWHPSPISRDDRRVLMQQRACCVWFTGLSGSGKSTIAHALEQRLHAEGRFTYVLDGDNIRHGLNRDLGFTEAARVENIRRVAEVARLMVDAGLVVIVAFISPFRADRAMARALFADDEFIEVFVDTPLDECERRDPKGLYRKARSGALPNFTGLDSPYEAPQTPEVTLDTTTLAVDACVERVRLRLP
jgi:bifunctional enzyme CysN/CysC